MKKMFSGMTAILMALGLLFVSCSDPMMKQDILDGDLAALSYIGLNSLDELPDVTHNANPNGNTGWGNGEKTGNNWQMAFEFSGDYEEEFVPGGGTLTPVWNTTGEPRPDEPVEPKYPGDLPPEPEYPVFIPRDFTAPEFTRDFEYFKKVLVPEYFANFSARKTSVGGWANEANDKKDGYWEVKDGVTVINPANNWFMAIEYKGAEKIVKLVHDKFNEIGTVTLTGAEGGWFKVIYSIDSVFAPDGGEFFGLLNKVHVGVADTIAALAVKGNGNLPNGITVENLNARYYEADQVYNGGTVYVLAHSEANYVTSIGTRMVWNGEWEEIAAAEYIEGDNYKMAEYWLNDELGKFYSYDEVEALIAKLEAEHQKKEDARFEGYTRYVNRMRANWEKACLAAQAKLDQYEIDLAQYDADLKALLDWEAANTGAFLGWFDGDEFFSGTREEYEAALAALGNEEGTIVRTYLPTIVELLYGQTNQCGWVGAIVNDEGKIEVTYVFWNGANPKEIHVGAWNSLGEVPQAPGQFKNYGGKQFAGNEIALVNMYGYDTFTVALDNVYKPGDKVYIAAHVKF